MKCPNCDENIYAAYYQKMTEGYASIGKWCNKCKKLFKVDIKISER